MLRSILAASSCPAHVGLQAAATINFERLMVSAQHSSQAIDQAPRPSDGSDASRADRAREPQSNSASAPPSPSQPSSGTRDGVNHSATQTGSSASKPSTYGSSSSDSKEIEKFTKLSQQWWSANGPFAALHALNSARLPFVQDAARQCFPARASAAQPLQDLSVIDVGCGGGILAETLARNGAQVLGIDLSQESITVAQQHAAQDSSLRDCLSYEQVSAEDVQDVGRRFDMVIASEVVEHVRHPAQFVQTLADLRKPGGCVVITTLHRTPESYALAIVAAENILGMAPKGAHDWNKFLTPDELAMLFDRAGLQMGLLAGMQLNLWRNEWQCTGHAGTNYAAMFCDADVHDRQGQNMCK